jgi:hypothetical protein
VVFRRQVSQLKGFWLNSALVVRKVNLAKIHTVPIWLSNLHCIKMELCHLLNKPECKILLHKLNFYKSRDFKKKITLYIRLTNEVVKVSTHLFVQSLRQNTSHVCLTAQISPFILWTNRVFKNILFGRSNEFFTVVLDGILCMTAIAKSDLGHFNVAYIR